MFRNQNPFWHGIAIAVISLALQACDPDGGQGATRDAGQLVSVEPMQAYLLPGVPIPVPSKAWHITYRSTTAQDNPTEVTGTVLVPEADWTGSGPRPLVGYAIGSQGMADRCAPSAQLQAGTEYETALIAAVLRRGWAVALTDYPGLGTSGDHTYVVGQSLGRAVLDSMRAARLLPEADLDPAAPLGIYGYSEGGAAAAWAIALQPSYAPDLPLAGGAVGAAPADFLILLDKLNKTRKAFLIMWGAIGFDAAYSDFDLDSILTPEGRAFRDKTTDTCLAGSAEGPFFDGPVGAQFESTDARDWFTVPEISELPSDWIDRFTENNLVHAVPQQTPVILGAGRGDEIMDYQSSGPGLYQSWCAQGANVQFYDIPISIGPLNLIAVQHIAGAFQFGPKAFAFLADRFAGIPLSRASDCLPDMEPQL